MGHFVNIVQFLRFVHVLFMLKNGGGGHKVVGTCQFQDEDTMDEKVDALIRELVAG